MRDLEFIEQALGDVAGLVRSKYEARGTLEVSSKKGPTDLLTEADLAVQDALVAAIRRIFPGDAIAAEERGMDVNPADPDCRCWVIDPIDGTQNFLRGMFPCFGVSLGLSLGGRPVAGGVAFPIVGDVFLAEQGAGAYRNGVRLRVSEVNSLDVARVEVDFASPWERPETLERASRLICETGQVRCVSSTVVGLCSVASGDMDGFFHVGLTPFDYAAGQIIAEEAGGKATRLDGSELRLFDGKRGALVTNGYIHEAVLGVLA